MIFTVQIKRASARLTLCTDSKFWWASRESNTAPTDYETHALREETNFACTRTQPTTLSHFLEGTFHILQHFLVLLNEFFSIFFNITFKTQIRPH